jgi:uncharacterized membrane protein
MRCGAKRADPSVAAALFSFILSGSCIALLIVTNTWQPLLSLNSMHYVFLVVCGLLSALTWLSLFTALTGGRVIKVVPVYLLWYLLTLVASHFLFGAPMGLWKICCIIVVLLGIVFIESRTKNLGGQLWFIYTIIAALATVGIQLVQRAFLGDIPSEAIFHTGRAVSACVILWLFVLIRGKQKTLGDLNARGWIGISFAALSLAASYACDYFAAVRGEISYLAPIAILSFAFAMLFARIFQKEKQSGAIVFGSLLVLLGLFGILMGL